MIWILGHFSTPEAFSYTQILSPKRTPSFFTDRRLLKKEHGVFKKRRGV